VNAARALRYPDRLRTAEDHRCLLAQKEPKRYRYQEIGLFRRDSTSSRVPQNPSVHGAFRANGETRIRTGDTTIFSRVLYQLSYLAAGDPPFA
jgi:hypothetical protein